MTNITTIGSEGEIYLPRGPFRHKFAQHWTRMGIGLHTKNNVNSIVAVYNRGPGFEQFPERYLDAEFDGTYLIVPEAREVLGIDGRRIMIVNGAPYSMDFWNPDVGVDHFAPTPEFERMNKHTNLVHMRE